MTSTIIDNFISGFAYGTTNVLVGQPLDTIKTRMQALGLKSTYQTGYEIFKTEGLYVIMYAIMLYYECYVLCFLYYYLFILQGYMVFIVVGYHCLSEEVRLSSLSLSSFLPSPSIIFVVIIILLSLSPS